MKLMIKILSIGFFLNFPSLAQNNQINQDPILHEEKLADVHSLNERNVIVIENGDKVCEPIARNQISQEGWIPQSPPIIREALTDVHTFNENVAIAIGVGGAVYKTIDQGINWLKINSGTTSNLDAIFFLDENTGWIVGSNGIILKTSDGGNSWRLIETDLNTLLDVYFLDANVGWVITSSRIYKTTNGGENWVEKFASAETTYFFESIAFCNASNGIAVGSMGKMYRTADGGENWAIMETEEAVWMFDVQFTTATHGWIAGLRASRISITIGGMFGGVSIEIDDPRYTLWETTDSGYTWTQRNFGFSGSLYGVYFLNETSGWATGTNGAVFTTNDGGSTWSVVRSVHDMNAVHFCNAKAGWAVGQDGTVLYTNNGGTLWTLQAGSGTNSALNSVQFIDSLRGWATGGKMLHTVNGGEVWFEQSAVTSASVFFINDQKGYSVSQSYPYMRYTIDEGDTWKNIIGPPPNMDGLNFVFFFDDQNGWAVGKNGNIMHTTNSAISWSGWVLQPSNTSEELNSVHFINPLVGWVVGAKGTILHTKNGGITWEQQQVSLNGWENLNSVYFINNNLGFIVGSIILKTTDGGTSWDIKTIEDSYFKSVYFADEYTGWIVGNKGVTLQTTDSGITWGVQKSGTTESLQSVQFVDTQTGYIVGWGGTILKTTTGGGMIYYPPVLDSPANNMTDLPDIISLSWQPVEGALSYHLQVSKSDDFSSSNYRIIDEKELKTTTYSLSDLQFKSTYYWRLKVVFDGFESLWSEIRTFTTGQEPWFVQEGIANSTTLYDVYFIDQNTGWAVGGTYIDNVREGTIYKTTDGGEHWELKNSPTSEYLNAVWFANASEGCIAGERGALMSTSDGDETWNLTSSPTTSGFDDFFFINSTTGWVVGNSGDILKTTNSGVRWISQLKLWNTERFNSVYFLNENIGYAAGSSLYKTTNGGNNWEYVSKIDDGANAIAFLDENIGIVCGGRYEQIGGQSQRIGTIYKTIDGGKHWALKSDSTVKELRDIFFLDAQMGYAVGSRGTILMTTDGGESWQKQRTGLPSEDMYFIPDLYSIYFVDRQTGWAVGYETTLKTIKGGITPVHETAESTIQTPCEFELLPNYPNPFNPETMIQYKLPVQVEVQLKVYNILGEVIISLVDEEQPAGNYTVRWDGKDENSRPVVSGVYLCCLQTHTYFQVKKMTLIR